jgi:hypothetical protein
LNEINLPLRTPEEVVANLRLYSANFDLSPTCKEVCARAADLIEQQTEQPKDAATGALFILNEQTADGCACATCSYMRWIREHKPWLIKRNFRCLCYAAIKDFDGISHDERCSVRKCEIRESDGRCIRDDRPHMEVCPEFAVLNELARRRTQQSKDAARQQTFESIMEAVLAYGEASRIAGATLSMFTTEDQRQETKGEVSAAYVKAFEAIKFALCEKAPEQALYTPCGYTAGEREELACVLLKGHDSDLHVDRYGGRFGNE